MNRGRKVYIETLGCQMNRNDSELMLGLLAADGFASTYERNEADLIIINTCQIRSNAEDKAYSYLGAWKKLKEKNPSLKIVMAGCVAQQTREQVFRRAPYVDIVIGTQNIHELPVLVRQAFEEPDSSGHLVAADRQKSKSTYDFIEDIAPIRESTVSAWVTVIEGCDYFCTYCVVPYTRGRQISRSRCSILDEVKKLADEGYQEVTLLGQTVDSYGKDIQGSKPYGLAHLLEEIHEQVPELARIRFMTSHPLDLSDAVIEAMAHLPRVMEYIHIPMQSGSNEILSRMHRGYTREFYFDLIDKIREQVPDIAISGDFIVGFPGETEEQFLETLDAIRQVRFDSSNTVFYSPRKQTPAGIWENRGEGSIPQEEKERRLHRINRVIEETAAEVNKAYQDESIEVLVEGKSKRTKFDRWRGRSRTNKIVHFDSLLPGFDFTGRLVTVKISETSPWALQGKLQGEPEGVEKPLHRVFHDSN